MRRYATTGSVEIDDVNPIGAVVKEVSCSVSWIVEVGCFLLEVALNQVDASAVSYVDGCKNVHCSGETLKGLLSGDTDKVRIYAQADVTAFFRVELCGKKIVTLDGTREGQSIVRGCDYLGVDCWACEV